MYPWAGEFRTTMLGKAQFARRVSTIGARGACYNVAGNFTVALTIHAVFDGQVLRPEESVGLEPNRRYVLRVEEDALPAGPDQEEAGYPLSALLRTAADLGVDDLAEQHDHYTRGGSS